MAEARQVGLVPLDVRPITPEYTFEKLRDTLQTTANTTAEFANTEGEYKELNAEREELRTLYSDLTDRLDQAKAFGSNRDAYEEELTQQSARLRALHLIPEGEGEAKVCPMCLSEVVSPTPKLTALRSELADVSNRITALHAQNPRLQSYINELSEQVDDIASRLRKNQGQINAVVQQNEILRNERESAVRRSRVLGKISAFFESETPDDGEELKTRLAVINARISELTSDLSGDEYEDRLRNVEYLLSDYMTAYARQLDLEHSEGRTRLDLKRLTVVSETQHGSIRLENMGSGDNWVGCHVITHLALHRLFRERERPVPAFLILDQPSKAHYPPSEQLVPSEIKDEDRTAVLRLFKFIYERTQSGGFQTIVIDHADEAEEWFQSSVVERWRGGEKLVPDKWQEANSVRS